MSDLEDIGIEQGERLISVESFPLGAKKILVTAFEGREELSSLSRFRLEVVSLGRALKPSEMLGKKLTVALRVRKKARKFSGVISRFEAMHSSIRDHHLHAIELVPPAWLLTLNRRCRIFHEKKATEIVDQVLQEAGVSSRSKSVGSAREYTVQYAESDFDFIARLLEEEGVFFRFDYEDSNCPIVLGDGAADYEPMDPETVEFEVDIDRWQSHYSVGSSQFTHADWDFEAVNVIEGSANGLAQAQPPGMPARSFYEYPGRFATTDDGRRLARLRMEEHETRFVWTVGGSSNVGLHAGAKFKIKDHSMDLPATDATTDSYALLQVDHRAHDFSDLPFEGETAYSNDFACIPASFGFRPERRSRKPEIRGPQTATVTDGPDDFGRAKVKFPWTPDSESCWVRVAQNWAYNQMGTQFLPRIDSEVVIEFLDGDPDRPIIVGMVYNGKNKLPFSLPANKTQSGLRGANWDDRGVGDKSNELRFEDRAGSEEIYLHAQKDFRRVVVNDDTLTIEGGDREMKVQTGNVSETLDLGNYSTKLSTGNYEVTLDTGSHTTKLSAGNHELKLTAGASNTEALQSITLKVGANSLKIDQTGITLKGMMIKIEGQMMLDLKGVMTNVKGDAMLTLKGGIAMVN